jgi:hypothetical protein
VRSWLAFAACRRSMCACKTSPRSAVVASQAAVAVDLLSTYRARRGLRPNLVRLTGRPVRSTAFTSCARAAGVIRATSAARLCSLSLTLRPVTHGAGLGPEDGWLCCTVMTVGVA